MRRIYISFIVLLILVACGAVRKPKSDTNKDVDLTAYQGPYYIIFEFFPRKSHSMRMGGIGYEFDANLLKMDNLDIFTESFYSQLAYFPFVLNDADYIDIANCLGFYVTWESKYPLKPLFSGLMGTKRIKLEDGNYLILKFFKVADHVEVKYVSEFKRCVKPLSIELDINKVKTINKMAIFIDRE